MSLAQAARQGLRASAHLRSAPLRHLRTTPAPASSPEREKCFVRLAGPACYADKSDISLFLSNHGVHDEHYTQSLVQGQSDVFQNHTVWLIETESQRNAVEVASRISGRVLGLKLVRASPVDRRLYDTMMTAPPASEKRPSLRRRMMVIAPTQNERGRALLARNLQPNLQPRVLWSFFAAYDVEDVRHLRRSGVATIVFHDSDEAQRALRERSNLQINNQNPIALKMHV